MKWKTPDGKWYITEAKPFGPVYGGYMDPNKYDQGTAYWYIKFM
jgi:hypothetical protein